MHPPQLDRARSRAVPGGWPVPETALPSAPPQRILKPSNSMKALLAALLTLAILPNRLPAEEILFQDDFKGKLGAGWSWVREDRKSVV